MKIIENFSEYYNWLHLEKPIHPFFDIRKSEESLPFLPQNIAEFQTPFYKISIKKKFKGNLIYGKTKFDTDKGLMLFMKPYQTISWNKLEYWEGYDIVLHPEFIKKNQLEFLFKKYNFFSYAFTESLFLTEKEEITLNFLFAQIFDLHNANADDSKTDLIASLLQVILNYADIFYKRQFRTRKELHSVHIKAFKELLVKYFQDDSAALKKPTAQYFSQKLHISTGYLNDLIQQELQQNTTDFINNYVMELSKKLLLQTSLSISEIAYQLGFENPPYFTKLFKQKNQVTPAQYRKSVKV